MRNRRLRPSLEHAWHLLFSFHQRLEWPLGRHDHRNACLASIIGKAGISLMCIILHVDLTCFPAEGFDSTTVKFNKAVIESNLMHSFCTAGTRHSDTFTAWMCSSPAVMECGAQVQTHYYQEKFFVYIGVFIEMINDRGTPGNFRCWAGVKMLTHLVLFSSESFPEGQLGCVLRTFD